MNLDFLCFSLLGYIRIYQKKKARNHCGFWLFLKTQRFENWGARLSALRPFSCFYAIIKNAPAAKMKGTVSMNTSVTNASHGNIEKEREELIDLVRTLTPEEVEKVIDRARQLLVPQ